MNEIHLSRRVDIAAPRDQVWAVLSRLDQIGRWAPGVDHASYTTEATEGIGAARRIQAGRQTLLETVTTWRAPATLAYRLDGLPPIVGTVTNRWDLTVMSGATTTATLTTIIDPGGSRAGKLVARGLIRVLGRASTGMLEGLRDHLAVTATATSTPADPEDAA